MKEKIKSILKHFGEKSQMQKAQEECSELITTIYHYNDGKASRQDLIEEIADTCIMMEQLKELFNTKNEIDDAIQRKLERTLERIKEGYYEKLKKK